jgi:nucleoid DNA-binding protein
MNKKTVARLKSDLDARTASQLGFSAKHVGAITHAFLYEVIRALAEGDAVHLRGLGTVYATIRTKKTYEANLLRGANAPPPATPTRLRTQVYLTMKKGPALTAAIRQRYGLNKKKGVRDVD